MNPEGGYITINSPTDRLQLQEIKKNQREKDIEQEYVYT